MHDNLSGINVAILAANGFDEHQLTEIQRELIKLKAATKTVAPEQGVMNGWQGDGWGHYFPVDCAISEALGSDFDALIIPGGERAIAKLKTNPHARRIINHFLEAEKPVSAIGAGVALLALSNKINGYTIAVPDEMSADLISAGAVVGDDNQEFDRNLLTSDGQDLQTWVTDTVALFSQCDEAREAA